jgi:hypothetical protein
MTLALRIGVAILALICNSAVFAAGYPAEEQLRRAIGEIASLAKGEALEIEILDAQKEGLTQPLMVAGLSLTSGACLVFYNIKPVDELSRFFDTMDERDLAVWLNAIAVHEVTHCIEQREAYILKRFDKVLPPGFTRTDVTLQGYLSVVQSGAVEKWGEALADIAALLYFKQAVPGEWQRFANDLATMRERLAKKYPQHDTASWLRKIIAADTDQGADQSIFEAAFQLRRQYRPDQ